MVYLDYSATCPVDEDVLNSFVKACDYFGNPNSLHKLGVDAKKLIDASSEQIANLIGVSPSSIVYTSGASEANNTIIKAMEFYKNRGCKIITTELEHSSIYSPLSYLSDKGFEIQFVPLKDGVVDLFALEDMLDDVCLVTISMVNSETGIRQPIEKIGKFLKKYPKVFFHTDITQALGKVRFDLSDVDFASFSAHKFFGLKGVGGFYMRDGVMINPLVSGGKSTTKFRSGTPATPLISSMAKALRLSYENMDDDLIRIRKLNMHLRDGLSKYDKVFINSNDNSIDHILNFSVLGVKPETFMHALEEDKIFISTQSACSLGDYSKAVLAISDMDRASSSLRVSISRKTTLEEIDKFLLIFDKCYKKLV